MIATDYGHLYIYYFPVVKHRNPTEYVEMLFVPKSGSPLRRVLLQDVRLPDPSSVRHHHVWGVVDRVYHRQQDATEDIMLDGGQLLADGPYSIIPEPDESMLAFELEFHNVTEALLQRMRLKPEGLYRMFVSAPGENRRLALEKPNYPKDVEQIFGERHRIAVSDRRLLDRPNVEFQLAAEKQHVSHEIDDFLHRVEPDFPHHAGERSGEH